jgi:uncharacterized protein YggT (Ycf19 family)
MSENIQQVKKVTSDGVATETTRVDDEESGAPATQDQKLSIVARIVWLLAGVLLVLLAFRFAFVLLGANPANGFVNFIYTASHPFAAPFFGIFGYSIKYGVSRVELSTLVAIVVYALVAYGISRLLTISQPRP